jgi:hypothetical protein
MAQHAINADLESLVNQAIITDLYGTDILVNSVDLGWLATGIV